MDMQSIAFVCFALLLASFGSDPAPPQRVPELHAISFAGQPVNLPDGLRGHATVLIVAFSENARGSVTLWSRRLAADFGDSPTVLYYEMPVLTGVPHFLQGIVLEKIRKDVPPPAQPRFVPILDHEKEWKAVTGEGTRGREDDAYLLVVDGAGNVRSELIADAPTDVTYADLKRRVQSVQP